MMLRPRRHVPVKKYKTMLESRLPKQATMGMVNVAPGISIAPLIAMYRKGSVLKRSPAKLSPTYPIEVKK